MELLDFAQFGVAIFSMGVLAFVVRLQSQKDKELIDHIRKQEENFVEIIKNHLAHNTNALNDLKEIMREVLILLRKNNSKK